MASNDTSGVNTDINDPVDEQPDRSSLVEEEVGPQPLEAEVGAQPLVQAVLEARTREEPERRTPRSAQQLVGYQNPLYATSRPDTAVATGRPRNPRWGHVQG